MVKYFCKFCGKEGSSPSCILTGHCSKHFDGNMKGCCEPLI